MFVWGGGSDVPVIDDGERRTADVVKLVGEEDA